MEEELYDMCRNILDLHRQRFIIIKNEIENIIDNNIKDDIYIQGGKSMVRNNVKVEINKEIAEIVDKYIAVVKENYDVVAIILFGSYAKGTEHKDSDIDIAVITDDIKTDTFDEEVKLMILRKGIDYRIEPHIITVADYENDETPFVVEVKNTGIKVA